MLPVLTGIIARRVLLNFRAPVDAVRPLVPAALDVVQRHGEALLGVCLIRLERIRPRGLPAWMGLSSENMAHRVAVRRREGDTVRDAVYIWRRETASPVLRWLGGRLFPGVHSAAEFHVRDEASRIEMDVATAGGEADVAFEAERREAWTPTPAFGSLDDVSVFFRRADCGYSCGRDGSLEGMRLRSIDWEMAPLAVSRVRAEFFERRFGGVGLAFDSAVLMRGLRHEWHEVPEAPSPHRLRSAWLAW